MGLTRRDFARKGLLGVLAGVFGALLGGCAKPSRGASIGTGRVALAGAYGSSPLAQALPTLALWQELAQRQPALIPMRKVFCELPYVYGSKPRGPLPHGMEFEVSVTRKSDDTLKVCGVNPSGPEIWTSDVPVSELWSYLLAIAPVHVLSMPAKFDGMCAEDAAYLAHLTTQVKYLRSPYRSTADSRIYPCKPEPSCCWCKEDGSDQCTNLAEFAVLCPSDGPYGHTEVCARHLPDFIGGSTDARVWLLSTDGKA